MVSTVLVRVNSDWPHFGRAGMARASGFEKEKLECFSFQRSERARTPALPLHSQQTSSIMSLHACNYNRSEYNNRIHSHQLFQQRCRSRSTRMATPSTSTSTSSTHPKLIKHHYTSTTCSDSFSALLKLINHHHYIQIAKGQLAVPSSPSRRPIPATSTFRRKLNHFHSSTSSRPPRKRIITVDFK